MPKHAVKGELAKSPFKQQHNSPPQADSYGPFVILLSLSSSLSVDRNVRPRLTLGSSTTADSSRTMPSTPHRSHLLITLLAHHTESINESNNVATEPTSLVVEPVKHCSIGGREVTSTLLLHLPRIAFVTVNLIHFRFVRLQHRSP
jgi:hypothetical protein